MVELWRAPTKDYASRSTGVWTVWKGLPARRSGGLLCGKGEYLCEMNTVQFLTPLDVIDIITVNGTSCVIVFLFLVIQVLSQKNSRISSALLSRSEQHGPAGSIWISILAIQRGKLAGCTVDRTLSCLQHSSMSNTDDDIKGMEHSMQTVYIRMGTSHQPSCSLVSCLSLNIPSLNISEHGLDTYYKREKSPLFNHLLIATLS